MEQISTFSRLRLDRPFVYAIIDNAANLPVFIGAVKTID
jgi:serine protease inhibitor